ncbi:MAG TPA: GNAT family N-acetyltransferase [Anaerolineales bacterium]|nr:GNAT family N-acetyltransferase [Anaerolineales bacterium]
MEILERAFSGNSDLQLMVNLVREFPAENLHRVDLAYRFSSWSFDYPENVRLWTDKNGKLLAWAVLQVPFWTIDYAYHPKVGKELHQLILKWADEQAQKIVNTSSGHPAWYVTVLENQLDRMRDLEQAGFESQANVGENSWSQVLMEHSTQISKVVNVPQGFRIRQLNGKSEIEAYVNLHRSVFESKNMTIEWRHRTLEHPEYISNLDLVAVAPDGQLAAFCICWLATDAEGEIAGQIEPLGVRAEFRQSGLGRAILLEGLKRLSSKGATRVYVQTESHRNAAFRLYESIGFHIIQNILIYRKDY